MAKLRNATTDIGAFVQWMGRKCRNHHPLKELGMTGGERAKLGRTYKTQASNEVFMVEDGMENKLVYMSAGRAFKIEVMEIQPEEAAEMQKALVGY